MAATASSGSSTNARGGSEVGLPGWQWLAPVPLGALIGLLIFARHDGNGLAVAILVAASASASGVLFGFLFGIPKSIATKSSNDSGYGPNTNLEQISDWLTKILVGIGLVQFSAFARHVGDLIRFLGPIFHDGSLGEAFAGGIITVFSLSGFLGAYLYFRLHLGGEFARADAQALERIVEAKINSAEQDQRAQEASDVTARALTNRQLDPEPGVASPVQQELNQAIAAASAPIKQQCYELARQHRNHWNNPTTRDRMVRAAPVFEALIAADQGRIFHQPHAQLAYVLKDQDSPDLQRAESELNEAIRIRDAYDVRGYLLYEFNRALTRTRLNRDLLLPDAVRAAIVKDLTAAFADRTLAIAISADPELAAFMPATTN